MPIQQVNCLHGMGYISVSTNQIKLEELLVLYEPIAMLGGEKCWNVIGLELSLSEDVWLYPDFWEVSPEDII
jgi:hypothetical protein